VCVCVDINSPCRPYL